MSEKEEDDIHFKVKEPEITERKPPNDKIIAYEIEENDGIVCPNCNIKNLKEAKFCSECGKRF